MKTVRTKKKSGIQNVFCANLNIIFSVVNGMREFISACVIYIALKITSRTIFHRIACHSFSFLLVFLSHSKELRTYVDKKVILGRGYRKIIAEIFPRKK